MPSEGKKNRETVSGRAVREDTERTESPLQTEPSAFTYPTSISQYLHSSFVDCHPTTKCICVLSCCLVISHKVLGVMSKEYPVSQPQSVAEEILASVSQLNTKPPPPSNIPLLCWTGEIRRERWSNGLSLNKDEVLR